MEKDNFDCLVHIERSNQDKKWGEQNHHPERWLAILIEEVGELGKSILEDTCTYGSKASMEHELIQVAAVAKAIWESGKRNKWLSTPNWDKDKKEESNVTT